MSRLDKVTVLGSGVLGGQIAWHSAFKGKTVAVYDIAPDAIERCRAAHGHYAAIYLSDVGADNADIAATREHLTYSTDLAAAVAQADLVIEAVPEIPEVKSAVYKEMAGLLPPATLVATNSSTLLPRDFASATGRPEKFCALHFSTSLWAMNFAEIMAHPGTAAQTLTEVTEFAVEIGMLPIPVRKEHNGYVVNTWLVPFLNAAQTLVTNGIARPEDVDRTFLFTGAKFGPLGIDGHDRHEDGARRPLPLGKGERRCADERQRRLHQDELPRPRTAGTADRQRLLRLPRPGLPASRHS